MSHSFEELSGRVIGAAIDVHKALGPGFLEPIYQRAMEVALFNRGIPFERQAIYRVVFEGSDVGEQRIDLVVGSEIVVELKAVKTLEDLFFAQTRSYLKVTGLRTGLLINFNASQLVVKRVVL